MRFSGSGGLEGTRYAVDLAVPDAGVIARSWRILVLCGCVLGAVAGGRRPGVGPWLLFLGSKAVTAALFFGYARLGASDTSDTGQTWRAGGACSIIAPAMDEEAIRRIAADSIALKQRFFTENAGQLLDVGRRIAERLRAGGKLLAFGNGGSAADAQHLVGELVGRFQRERPGLAALALGTDTSVLTAIGNDFGYEAVFGRQVEALGRPGDVALGITTSGRSANVVEGLRAARARSILTLGLSGGGGGELRGLVDHLIDVPHTDTQRIQEVHGMVIHVLCQIIEESL